MHHMFQVDGKPISLAQAMKVSKIENSITAIVPRKECFTGPLQSSLRYTRVFKNDSGVRFLEVRITVSQFNVMVFNFLATNVKVTYVSHRLFAAHKNLIKQKDVMGYLCLRMLAETKQWQKLSGCLPLRTQVFTVFGKRISFT